MSYNDIKLFKLTDTSNNVIYYGHTKSNLSRKLAELEYLYKLDLNCNTFKSVFDKYGIDNIRIGFVDAMSFNDIDHLNKKIDDLTQNNVINHQLKPNAQEHIQTYEPEHIQTYDQQPLNTYNKIKTTEQQPVINSNIHKKSYASLIQQIASN